MFLFKMPNQSTNLIKKPFFIPLGFIALLGFSWLLCDNVQAQNVPSNSPVYTWGVTPRVPSNPDNHQDDNIQENNYQPMETSPVNSPTSTPAGYPEGYSEQPETTSTPTTPETPTSSGYGYQPNVLPSAVTPSISTPSTVPNPVTPQVPSSVTVPNPVTSPNLGTPLP